MLLGVNHITLAVRDLAASFSFYVDIVGAKPEVRWEKGAYLRVGCLWLCLSVDPNHQPASGYSHIAFTLAEESFAQFCGRLTEHAVIQWKKNASEGASFYFLDPDGHKLEAHVGCLASRLHSLKYTPYAQLEWFS